VATPADLDGLLEQLAGTPQTDAGVLEGEHLFATERLVVSPSTGVFALGEGVQPGLIIDVGHVLGTVGADDVVSSFAGEVMGVLALEGERVGSRQPIAWLRTR
jgi:[acyl-carrier-protein] S-malonyltransferase